MKSYGHSGFISQYWGKEFTSSGGT